MVKQYTSKKIEEGGTGMMENEDDEKEFGLVKYCRSSSSSGARSGTDIGDHASPNISVIRQLQKI